MGFDWEEILDADGEDLQDAYDDRVWDGHESLIADEENRQAQEREEDTRNTK